MNVLKEILLNGAFILIGIAICHIVVHRDRPSIEQKELIEELDNIRRALVEKDSLINYHRDRGDSAIQAVLASKDREADEIDYRNRITKETNEIEAIILSSDAIVTFAEMRVAIDSISVR